MDDADKWATTYSEAASDTTFTNPNVAISSFPHNEQGKDFRFNIRILLAEGGTSTRQVSSFKKIVGYQGTSDWDFGDLFKGVCNVSSIKKFC